MSRRKRPRERPMTLADRVGLAMVGVGLLFVLAVVAYNALHEHPAGPGSRRDAVPHGHDAVPIILAPGLPPLPASTAPLARPKEMMAEAYQFAAEHPEILRELPCFCGCMKRGHRSNHDCFVLARDASGDVTWSAHGLSCGMCVDIARDAKGMLALGKAITEIRRAIDDAYGPRS